MYKVIVTEIRSKLELSNSLFHTFQEAYDKYVELYKAFRATAKEVEVRDGNKQERTFDVLDKEEEVIFSVWIKHPKRRIL